MLLVSTASRFSEWDVLPPYLPLNVTVAMICVSHFTYLCSLFQKILIHHLIEHTYQNAYKLPQEIYTFLNTSTAFYRWLCQNHSSLSIKIMPASPHINDREVIVSDLPVGLLRSSDWSLIRQLDIHLHLHSISSNIVYYFSYFSTSAPWYSILR